MNSMNSNTTKPLYRGTQIVWYLLGILEVVLAFRFLLKFLGANPNAGFTEIIYSLSVPFVNPFLSVFNITQVEGAIFEWTTLLAMLVYWLIALAVVKLFIMSRSVSTPEATVKLEDQDN